MLPRVARSARTTEAGRGFRVLRIALGGYLHCGRHVDAARPEAGTFPVDHLDASFTLDVMRVTLAHLSQILAAEVRRLAPQ
jgi:hypothetical protein